MKPTELLDTDLCALAEDPIVRAYRGEGLTLDLAERLRASVAERERMRSALEMIAAESREQREQGDCGHDMDRFAELANKGMGGET